MGDQVEQARTKLSTQGADTAVVPTTRNLHNSIHAMTLPAHAREQQRASMNMCKLSIRSTPTFASSTVEVTYEAIGSTSTHDAAPCEESFFFLWQTHLFFCPTTFVIGSSKNSGQKALYGAPTSTLYTAADILQYVVVTV
jgi:hypothetical protein